MCGIVGYISTDDKLAPVAKRHFMDYALTLDTLRGADSTGLIILRDEFDVYTAHTTASGREYVLDEHYEGVVKEPAWAMIGHNRAATAGSVKLENAHPFEFGDINLVHNGTLMRKGADLPSYDWKLEVDSMQIALALSKAGPDDVADVLATINGSFMLVWTDKRNGTINMARNSDRPFHFTFNESKDIMWFMSDGDHLNAINKSLARSVVHGKAIYKLDTNKWLRWRKGSLTPEVKTFKNYVAPVQVYTTPSRKEMTTAMNRAANRWTGNISRQMPYYGEPGKYQIAWERRKIPVAHTDLLTQYYEMESDTMVSFTADTWQEGEGKMCTVFGSFVHPEWDGEWPMILFRVPKVVCTSYYTRPWAVKVKGLTLPQEGWDDSPSVLGELYSNDAKAMGLIDDPVKETDDGLVMGPEERLMSYGQLMQDLQKGCVQCGSNLSWEHKTDYMYVNEGRDLLCDMCVEDMERATG